MEISSVEELRVSDEETIRRVVSGAKDEFRYLVEVHQNKVFGMIVRQVGNDQLARELTQDVFLKAYLHLSSFRFQASFSTWLIRIALNVTNSYFTSKRYKNEMKTVSFDSAKHGEQALPEEREGYDQELIERLRAAIAKLKPKYREVLVLCAFERKKYEEAASILGVPIGTIRSRLNKARLLLKDELEGCMS